MTQNAYRTAGFWPSVRLQSVTFEISRGPWKSQAFFQQQLEAMHEWLAELDDADPLFEHFVAKICRDKQLDPASASTSAIIEDMRSSKWLERLGPKTAQTRWFSWHEAQEFYQPHTGERLAGLCFLGIFQGWFHTADKAGTVITSLRSKSEPFKEDAKETMQQAQAQEAKLRDRCSNGLHLSATILANEDIQMECRTCLYMATMQRQWHSHFSHFLKDTNDGLQLSVTLAQGNRSFEIIAHMSTCLGDPAGLEVCGLMVDLTASRLKGLKMDDPEVMSQQERLLRMSSLMWALMSEEVSFILMWKHTYPYRLAAMLIARDDEKTAELQRMRRLWTAWQHANSLAAPFWKSLLPRLSFHWVITKEIFLMCAEHGWRWTPALTAQITRLFTNMGSTIVVERAFQAVRDHERDVSNKKLGATAVWRKPITDQVLNKKHSYPEVDARQVPHHEVVGLRLPKNFYTPSLKDSSDNLSFMKSREWSESRT